MKKTIPFLWLLLLFVNCLQAQEESKTKIEPNVIYGRHGGLALLMDVHRPENANGFGIVVFAGCGWHSPLGYDSWAIGNPGYFGKVIGTDALLKNGYTVFTAQYRTAPVFRYPAPVQDAQRAVQFVRHHAKRFGIDSTRIGALGHSSGGHLVSMLGTLDDKKDANAKDLVNQKSSRVQAVAALSPVTDFFKFIREREGELGAASSFLGVHFMSYYNPEASYLQSEYDLILQASPVTHVTADDVPFLIVHGDEDKIVPVSQAEVMVEKLNEKGVPTKYVAIESGNHFLVPTNIEQEKRAATRKIYTNQMVEFFDKHLIGKK